jgi:NADH-quinone oxidoreductase subunit L
MATVMYRKSNPKPDKVAAAVNGLYKASYNKFWFDEVWMFVTKKIIFNNISRPIAWFDRNVVDGFMNFLSILTNFISRKIKIVQSGEIQDYSWAFIMGTLVIVVLMIFV